MIPKKIHYCWFGDGEKSELVKKCIASWKQFCPDCEIIEWNESNYDLTKNQYMYEAYQAKRWGFVPDYARLDIIYEHGGIYLDTDVEMIRSFDDLFEQNGYMGFESATDAKQTEFSVNGGQGFAAPPKNELIRQMRDIYDGLHFINEDGSHNLQPSPYFNTLVLKQNGLVPNNTLQVIDGITIYPSEYFCPVNWKTHKREITENTHSIHHFDASWVSASEKKKRKRQRMLDQIVHFPNRVIRAILGQRRYDQFKSKFGR